MDELPAIGASPSSGYTLDAQAVRTYRPLSQRGEVSLDFLAGEMSSRSLVRQAGLLASGWDAVSTARTAATLMEQGNLTAAQSEVNHALARSAGGWLGGASTAAVLGSSSGFVPAALIVGDALLMSKAFDKLVDLKENRDIYQQTDKAGVQWQFNGRNWERDAHFENKAAGQAGNTKGKVVASYEKSLELSAQASVKAVELALGKVSPARDPFDLPALPSDRIGLDNPNWKRNPETERWERVVKVDVTGANDRGVYERQFANEEQTQRLNQLALDRIEQNIGNSRQAIAQTYLEGHAAMRAQDYGVAVPAAVESARARPGQLQGRDGQLYLREAEGQWKGEQGAVSGNLELELELTYRMRQPSLERAETTLAALKATPAATAEQRAHNELVHGYQTVGINITAQQHNLEAVQLAVARTQQDHGVAPPGMWQLQRDENGNYGYDSPIVHFQTGADGSIRQLAVTTSEDIRQAKAELQQGKAVFQPAQAEETITLEAVSALPTQSQSRLAAGVANDESVGLPVFARSMADAPDHPDHAAYQRIHTWVQGTGQWDEVQCRNVSAALYRQQMADPLIKQVDQVSGGLGNDGAHNVFAVHAPYADKGPFFHACVDGRMAALEPAAENLQQAEVLRLQQADEQALQQARQQTQEQATGMGMGGL